MPEIPQNMTTKEHSLLETWIAPFLLCNFSITFGLIFKITQLQMSKKGLKKLSSKNNAMLNLFINNSFLNIFLIKCLLIKSFCFSSPTSIHYSIIKKFVLILFFSSKIQNQNSWRCKGFPFKT